MLWVPKGNLSKKSLELNRLVASFARDRPKPNRSHMMRPLLDPTRLDKTSF